MDDDIRVYLWNSFVQGRVGCYGLASSVYTVTLPSESAWGARCDARSTAESDLYSTVLVMLFNWSKRTN